MSFQNWTFEQYVEQFNKDKSVRFIEPMSAHEILALIQPDSSYTFVEKKGKATKPYESDSAEFAELKYDGHRGLVYIGEKCRAFSRVPSKVTGWFGENTDQIPHIRDMETGNLFGTVLDGEFDYGNTSMGVQSVMGALPDKAIQFQKEHGFIPFRAFDILYYKGINVQRMPLWKRKVYLAKALLELGNKYIEFATMYMTAKVLKEFYNNIVLYTDDEVELQTYISLHCNQVESHEKLFSDFLDEEQEGIMIKQMYGIYEQKRGRNYLKVKGQSTWDCIVMGYTKSTKVYEGKELKTWKYWESTFNGELINAEMYKDYEAGGDLVPVTKPYFMGWCGGISFGVWNPININDIYHKYCEEAETYIDQAFDEGLLAKFNDELYELVQVGDCKGLTEKIMQSIKDNGDDFIGTVIEVKANGIIDPEKGSLRHPRFGKWRADKIAEQCTWNDHVRNVMVQV